MASDKNHNTVFISAKTRENVDELRSLLYEEVKRIHIKGILIMISCMKRPLPPEF